MRSLALIFLVPIFFLAVQSVFANENLIGQTLNGDCKTVSNGKKVGKVAARFDDTDNLTWCFRPTGQEQNCAKVGYKIRGDVIEFGGQRTRFYMTQKSNGWDVTRHLDGNHTENCRLK